MTNWESSLQNLATGTDWDLGTAGLVSESLKQLQDVLSKVSGETGFTGTTDLEASTSMGDAKTSLNDLIDWLDNTLPKALEKANEARADAAKALGELGAGSLTQDQTNAIRAAEVGATLYFGPVAVVVGEGAIAAANAFFGNQRESQAETAYRAASDKMDDARDKLVDPPALGNISTDDPESNGPDDNGGTPPYIGGQAGPRSYEAHPDFGVAPPPAITDDFVIVDPDGTVRDEDGETGEVIDWDPYVPETPIIMPNPDGPVGNGIITLPNHPGGGLGGGGLGGGGLGGGGLGGGGLGNGLMVGAGGGAAMAGMAKLAALRGGAGGALGALGGRGGLTPNAGGAGARAGGTGGLLGSRGAGAGVGAAEGAAAGRPGGVGMMGGGGAPGGAGGKGDKRGRGLGGPIAPTMEDDEEFGPRSENAGAGGRD